MYYILVIDGIAHESIPEWNPDLPGSPIDERYPKELLDQCVVSDEPISSGWVYDPETGTFHEPPAPEPGPTPEPPDPMARYNALVPQYIRERYSADDEIGLTNKAVEALSKGEAVPPEYDEYRAYVEACKKRAWDEVFG